MRLNPRLAGYTPATVGALIRSVYDRVSTLPGVRSATVARYSPLSGSSSKNAGNVEGYTPKAGEDISFETIQVGPAYHETLGMRLVQGRALDLRDTTGAAKVAMVNEAFVRHFFPDGRGVGRQFGFNREGSGVEIVGVLNDAHFHDARDEIKPIVFMPMLQEASQFALDCELEIRAAVDAATISNQVRQAVADIDRNLPINDTRTLRAQVAATFDSQRLAAQLVGFFGALALLLASVGLYGVLALAVHRRTREIGVRMALGAQRVDVLGLVVRQAVTMTVAGVMIGVVGATALTRLLASYLFEVRPLDPPTFVVTALVLVGVALIASYLPARRASGVDPVIALRAE